MSLSEKSVQSWTGVRASMAEPSTSYCSEHSRVVGCVGCGLCPHYSSFEHVEAIQSIMAGQNWGRAVCVHLVRRSASDLMWRYVRLCCVCMLDSVARQVPVVLRE